MIPTLWLLLHFVLLFDPNNAKGSVQDLYKKLFMDINPKLRPVLNHSTTLYVGIYAHLRSLVDVSEVEQRVRLNTWVNLTWTDELRVWNPEDYEGKDMFFMTNAESWFPHLLVSNSVEGADSLARALPNHYIFYNGTVRFYPQGVLEISCNMKMSYFPFDTQTCHLRVLTLYLSPYVRFYILEKEGNDNTALSGYIQHGEWDIFNVIQEARDEFFDQEVYAVYHMTFDLTRKPAFAVIVILLPVMLLSVISLLVFLLPMESGEKVSFSITVLLSLSVFTSFMSDLLPRNSQSIPILVIYLFSLMVLTGLAVISTILTMASQAQESDNADSIGKETIYNNSGRDNLAYESQDSANKFQLQSNIHINVQGECLGNEQGHGMSTASSFNTRSAFNGANESNFASPGDRIFFQNGVSNPGSIEGFAHPSSNKMRCSSTNLLDPHRGEHRVLSRAFMSRRRSSTYSQGSVFDKIGLSARRSSFCPPRGGGAADDKQARQNRSSWRASFLNRISHRDRLFFGAFFVAWSILTCGYLIVSTIQL